MLAGYLLSLMLVLLPPDGVYVVGNAFTVFVRTGPRGIVTTEWHDGYGRTRMATLSRRGAVWVEVRGPRRPEEALPWMQSMTWRVTSVGLEARGWTLRRMGRVLR